MYPCDFLPTGQAFVENPTFPHFLRLFIIRSIATIITTWHERLLAAVHEENKVLVLWDRKNTYGWGRI